MQEQHSNVSWGTLMVLFALFRVDLLAGLTESYLSLHDGFYAKHQEYMAFLTTFATMSKIIESINPNLHVLRKLLKSNLKLGVSMFAQNGIYKRILRCEETVCLGSLQQRVVVLNPFLAIL